MGAPFPMPLSGDGAAQGDGALSQGALPEGSLSRFPFLEGGEALQGASLLGKFQGKRLRRHLSPQGKAQGEAANPQMGGKALGPLGKSPPGGDQELRGRLHSRTAHPLP